VDLAALRSAVTSPGSYFETVQEDVRGERLTVFRHRARTLRELLVASAHWSDRPFLVDGDVRLDVRTHLAWVDAVASGFQQEHGIGAGDRVAIFAANRWEWVVAYWALLSIGAVPAAFNGWWTGADYSDAVSLVEPVLVIGDAARLERARSVDATPLLPLESIAGLVSAHAGRHPRDSEVHEDDPAVLFFTSGTTGRAKAVCVPHRALIGFAQLTRFGDVTARVAMGGPVPGAGEQLAPSDDIVLVTSPLFHTSMLNGVVLNAVASGGAFVLLPGKFDPEAVLAVIERERVTRWLALGSAGPRVASSPAIGRYDTSSVRALGIGGAPVSPAVQDALRRSFPSASNAVGMGYTSTEAGAVIANIGGAELVAHPTSTGRVTATTEVELRALDGSTVAEGEYGEVHVRSPYLMLGYWQDPEATARTLKPGGWLALGDIARLADGLLYIDSRARDMILVSAENVSPTEVEYCLEAHPGVAEAAVFAVDDELTGDAVCAAVVLTEGSATTESDLSTWCAPRLAHYKVPTRWLFETDPLPRTASGKLVKNDLRTRATLRSREEGSP
jgi:acyl-CoA synthetase (AMP-forming)/AMP-acid ligase II